MEKLLVSEAAALVRFWISGNGIQVLNVAGPRASKDSLIYQVTTEVFEAVLKPSM